MDRYSETQGVTLLDNIPGTGQGILRLYRINDEIIRSWPHILDLPVGRVEITEKGVVTYIDNAAAHPAPARQTAAGAFHFTVWDGVRESPTYASEVRLQAVPRDTLDPVTHGYGWNPDHDAGLEGDLFVDARTPRSGDGRSPETAYRTLNEALAAARRTGRAQEIKLLAGTYREAISTEGLAGRISRYGRDRVRLTGAEPLTGFVPCTESDSPLLGTIWQGVYKTRISRSAFASESPGGLNLYENGTPMPLAQSRPDAGVDRFFFGFDRTFNKTGTFLVRDGVITGLQDPSVIQPSLTDAQLQHAFVMLRRAGNAVARATITGADIRRGRLRLNGNLKPDPKRQWYNLVNCLPMMRAGEWGYIETPDGDVIVFVHPNQPGRVNQDIEYSARTYVVDYHPGQRGPLHLEGLEIVQPAGSRKAFDGHCIGFGGGNNNDRRPHPLIINHCYAGRNLNTQGNGYGAIWLRKGNQCRITNTTIEYCAGSYGIFIHGDPDATSDGTVISNVFMRHVGQAPARFYGATNTIHAYSFYRDCGFGGHVNQFNFYLGCDTCLNYGIMTRGCVGYATFQDATRIHFLFCDLMASADPLESGGRALADQNGRRNNLIADKTADNYVIHCQFLPHKDRLNKTNAVMLGEASLARMGWHMINTILHGGGTGEAFNKSPAKRNPGIIGRRAGNLYTAMAFWQKPAYGWQKLPDEMITQATKAYRNPAAGDFTPSPRSLILRMRGADWSGERAVLERQFPGFDFGRDMTGATVNAHAPGFIGPRADASRWSE